VYLVRVGYRTVNLEYLIQAADSGLGAPPDVAPAGGVRVSIYPGEQFDVTGREAADLRLHLEEALRPPPGRKPSNGRDRPGGGRGKTQPLARPKGGRMRPVSPASPKSSPQDE